MTQNNEKQCDKCRWGMVQGDGKYFCTNPDAYKAGREVSAEGHCILWKKPLAHDRRTKIQDSGKRREFETGAVRDISVGKGRCDLLPLDVISDYLYNSNTLKAIAGFINSKKEESLFETINFFVDELGWDKEIAILETSILFEEGCNKYGDRNWEKGIPIHCYIDSAVRHYLKWSRGDDDERHDRAVLWNLMCCIWTLRHKPEMRDI